MFFSLQKIASALVFSVAIFSTAFAEDGTTTINGTEVQMKTDYSRDVVTFSNKCGTQTMSRRDLLRGAIPRDIVPCPRTSANVESPDGYTPAPAPSVRYGALAAGIDENFFTGSRVSVGSALRYSSPAEANSQALSSCRANGVRSCRVVSTFTGCAYITTSTDGSNPVAWGMGPTAQAAYNNCYARVDSGNCDTDTIGGCNN